MPRVRIDDIEAHDHILDKIERKHRLSLEEVREACFSVSRQIRRGRAGTTNVLGVTYAGRYLFIVLVRTELQGLWRVVTARDMIVPERRLFLRKRS